LKIYHKQAWPIEWAETQGQIAASLEQLGDMTDNLEDLKQSIALCRQVLDGFPRKSNPDIWTDLQTTLGGALVVSYRIDKDLEFAGQAEIAFRDALQELSARISRRNGQSQRTASEGLSWNWGRPARIRTT